jgi:hypothetical protein
MYREGDWVRLKVSCQYGGAPHETLPSGAVGQVADVLGGGRGLAIEFTLREPVFSPNGEVVDFGKFELMFLNSDEVEPAP